MDDFGELSRNSAWWSTDCRRDVNGETVEVILEKQNLRRRNPTWELPERQQEAMRMGLFMQPHIARLFEDAQKIRVKAMDDEMTHPTEPWMKSHFDFITEDNLALVETKNYNHAAAVRFSEEGEPVRIPAADMAQCVHEACVACVSVVYLAVLFGGQHFRTFRIDVTDEMKISHIKHYATLWAHVVQGTLPEPKTSNDARLVWPQDNGDFVLASKQCETIVEQFKAVKTQRKILEDQEEQISAYLQTSMGNASEIRTIDGRTLVTWKTAKGTKTLDTALFKSTMPDTYEKFIIERAGSRRLIVK
jgi:predicted phage-related endonuclease